jgi:hypothetical protein
MIRFLYMNKHVSIKYMRILSYLVLLKCSLANASMIGVSTLGPVNLRLACLYADILKAKFDTQ